MGRVGNKKTPYEESFCLDLELGHQFVVGLVVGAFQVAHQAAAFANLFDETTAGREVLLVGLQVVGQLFDLFAQDGDLDLRGTGIGGMGLEFLDDFLLLLWV